MLSLRVLPKSITAYFRQSSQQIYTFCQILSAKDSSSSSDSSDSDSDSDKKNKKTKKQIDAQLKEDISETINVSNTNERLEALLLSITSVSSKSKNKIKVGIKPKEERFKKLKSEKPIKEKPYEQQLVAAAKDVAKTFNGDQNKIEAELLNKVLYEPNKTDDKNEASIEKTIPEDSTELSDLLVNMKIEAPSHQTSFMPDYKNRIEIKPKLKMKFYEPSVAESLLITKSKKNKRFTKTYVDKTTLQGAHQNLGILQNFNNEQAKDNVQLSIWEEMEVREIKLSLLTTSQNVFQELIEWTQQGKLWRFPINNEQGLEQEEKIHFSEHVFMERHIKDWCPKKGPIRHFMELVCVGLSKNPYMTVEEKIKHITWYKDYFEAKKDLLRELGALDDKTIPVLQSSVDKNQIGA